jgi:dolichol-phosphate mannosyltransferase
MADVPNLVIIPTYNEAGNILRQIAELESVRSHLAPDHLFDVLIVDDGSPDGTAKLVTDLNLPWICVEVRSEKSGLGNAYKHGFAWAKANGYKFVIEMDADGSHQTKDLYKLLEAPAVNDLVIGSRWIPEGEVENWPLHRRLLSQFGNVYSSIALGFKIKDSTSGFRRISLSALDQIDMSTINAKGYGFQIEMAYRIAKSGRTVCEVPITFIERIEGKSKMSIAIVIEALLLIAELGIQRIFF